MNYICYWFSWNLCGDRNGALATGVKGEFHFLLLWKVEAFPLSLKYTRSNTLTCVIQTQLSSHHRYSIHSISEEMVELVILIFNMCATASLFVQV
jgi:hypothetical protein